MRGNLNSTVLGVPAITTRAGKTRRRMYLTRGCSQSLNMEKACVARRTPARLRDIYGTPAKAVLDGTRPTHKANIEANSLGLRNLAEREGFYYRHYPQLPTKPTLQ